MKTFFLLLPLLVLSALHAAEEVETPPVLKAENTKEIDEAMGKEVYVEGTVREAFWVRGDVLMLTFREEKTGFIAVSFKKYRKVLDEAFDDDITKALKGKSVKIKGVIEEYNYRPQIVIKDSKQIELIPQ